MEKKQIAVFIDRDGTINQDRNYLDNAQDFEFIPGAADAIKKLNECGLKVVVITNQSGIARGILTEETLSDIHDRMVHLLATEGAYLDGIYYCPHHPDDGCDCRKPATGMVRNAIHDLDVDIAHSYIIGDKRADVHLGHNLGLTSILVLTGYGREENEFFENEKAKPDFVADNLRHAAEWIISQLNK